jgi:hypothetical protein
MQRGVCPSAHSWSNLQPTFEGPGGTPAPAGGTPTLPRTRAASEQGFLHGLRLRRFVASWLRGFV